MQTETEVPQKWLVFEDEEMTVAMLETAVNERVAKRRLELGQPAQINLPTFGYLSPMPEPPENNAVSPTLYYHLRQLNEMPPPDTKPILAQTASTQVPILGRLWRMIRENAHQLVLFYVNRGLTYETVLNNHTLNTLNELTRLTQSQQEEIARLQAELDQLQKSRDRD